MPIMPYVTSNPQINSTGRSLKEHVFRSQFIAFVVFSIPETEKRKTQNKSWKQKMDSWKRLRFQFSFYRFPFNGKRLRFLFFRMRESENENGYWKPFSVSYSVVDFRNTEQGYRYECWKQKRESRKAEDVFRFRFFSSFVLYRHEKRRTVLKTKQ